ncbi:MAG TPA: hypothetical protein VFL14_09295, partial [Xanthomonadales bacterium]|nr:hypothetical protein [Xanthomonadales bacterium]
REQLLTSAFTAKPQIRWASPDRTPWPFWSAIAITIAFVGSIFTPWAVVWGAVPVAVAMTTWFWPKRSEPSLAEEGAP